MSKESIVGALILYLMFLLLSMSRGVSSDYLMGSGLSALFIIVGIYLGDQMK